MFCYDWKNGYIAPFVRSENAHVVEAFQKLRLILAPSNASPLSEDEIESQVLASFEERSLTENQAQAPVTGITSQHVIYDLGCGDGRVPCAFSKVFGCRTVGVELDNKLLETARQQAEQLGVTSLTSFQLADLRDVDLSEATLIYMYLLPDALRNSAIQLKLLEQWNLGKIIVSNRFPLPYFDMYLSPSLHHTASDAKSNKVFIYSKT